MKYLCVVLTKKGTGLVCWKLYNTNERNQGWSKYFFGDKYCGLEDST